MLLARLVAGRYGDRTMDERISPSSQSSRPGWIVRLVTALFGRKSAA